ncbi:MAG TPA: heterodisulfide reductase-related iron-sulfur binding cluster [Myxococcota bacterium]|nr:heterodisulfide reductase-related iron-sulfur binding cluster [Myxococcota bacterium]
MTAPPNAGTGEGAPAGEVRAAAAGAAPGGPLAALYPGTLDCVHCGLCLPACPTYRVTGRETSSPRGRVALMRGVAEGRLALDALAEEAYLCLGCRACETACPSGVRFGALLEETRAAVERAGLRSGVAKRIETFALGAVIPKPRRLRLAVDLVALAQRLRLDRLARALLPARVARLVALAPAVPPRAERARLPARIAPLAPMRGRVALFEGCIMPELFGAVNAATARVLAREGFEVVVPRGQGCCGALQAHAGNPAAARDLAAANVAAFAQGEVDAVVVNSAGCGAALREAGDWLGPAGAGLAARVRDVCEFLDDVGLRGAYGPVRGTLCYDDPCHLIHGQRVDAAPRRLLARIPELRLVPHADPGSCCGAAGIYNLTHAAMSNAILDRKLDALAAADPDWIATGNPGCILQLRSGVAARGLRASVVHPVELLDRAAAAADADRLSEQS